MLLLVLGTGLTAFYVTVDRLLVRRALQPLTWAQRRGGLWRGSLLVAMILPALVFVAAVIGIPLADAMRDPRIPEELVQGEDRRGAVLGVTVLLVLLLGPPVFASGPWRRARRDRCEVSGAPDGGPPPIPRA
ncbi:hypothetical protein C8046_16805 [Serinibacter arcticus]|uniref:Uncharacterized protein n=1 Tax=Serinibacter arcticus TaxID=1655435 RepID=A0A2U1ZYI8_9MICO|nr:hypothetical protein [Serinibacter arcticus]PWD52058.1 hypothetical protein C8046_16805 [Serinibacter arcticus]